MTTYRIRPLVWDEVSLLVVGVTTHEAKTAFGKYRVHEWSRGGATWVPPHGLSEEADTLEDAKEAAESHWHDRLKQCLDPVTGEQA